MLINEAFAQTSALPTAQGGGLVEFLTPLVVVIAIFYMLVWRPQGKRMKAHEEMVGGLAVGDKVITAGGVHGTVSKLVDEATIDLEIADRVVVTFNRQSVSMLVEKKAEAKKSTAKNTTKKKAA